MAKPTKDLRISFLLDFYGPMLTEKQQEVVSYYYNEDLSLAEIALISGITRQGVRDSIKRAEKQLIECEEKLGLQNRFHEIQNGLNQISDYTNLIYKENKRLTDSKIIEANLQKINEITSKLNQ